VLHFFTDDLGYRGKVDIFDFPFKDNR